MWNRIRAVVLGALVLATGACATVKPQEALSEPLVVVAASVLIDSDNAASIVRAAIDARRSEPAKITAVAVMCAPRQEAEIVSAALQAVPEEATAIRNAARWAARNRSTVAMSIPRAEDIARLIDRAMR